MHYLGVKVAADDMPYSGTITRIEYYKGQKHVQVLWHNVKEGNTFKWYVDKEIDKLLIG